MSFIEDKWAWMDNMDEEELKCTIVRITNEHKQAVAELKKRIDDYMEKNNLGCDGYYYDKNEVSKIIDEGMKP